MKALLTWTRHAAIALLVLTTLVAASTQQARAAVTPPAISIGDAAGNTIIIDSTGTATSSGSCTATSCITTSTSGICQVNWTGTLGSYSFSLCGTFALFGTPSVVPYLDINLSGLLAPGPGTLTIKLTNTNVSAAPSYTMGVLNTADTGVTSAVYSAYADPTNTAFNTTGTAVLLGSLNATGTFVNTAGPSGSSISITTEIVVGLTPGANYSTDFYLLPSPDVSSSCAVISATQGTAITPVTITPTGGIGPYTITASGLPPGLTLTNGQISGAPTQSGTFPYTLTFTDQGDNNNVTSTTCSITVAPPTNNSPPVNPTGPITGGDAATIGFWHNKNGQALIDSMNGSSSSTALGNWLATTFPYLYGAQAGGNNMTNKPNTAVAALDLAFFGQGGQKTSAQVLAGALAVYVTSTALGGSTAVGYGFNSSVAGTGSKTINVGSNGSAIGLTNGTSYTVLQLLTAANAMQKAGTYNANAFNTIFSDINQTGDIN